MKKQAKTDSLLRQRIRNYEDDDSLLPEFINIYNKNGGKKDKNKSLPLPATYMITLLGLMVIVFILVIIIEKKLPPGLKIAEEYLYPERFIAERAMNNLINLTKFGPRVTGSVENEVLSVEYLVGEVKDIVGKTSSNHLIEYDVQRSSGAFPLHFLDGMTNVYRGVQNVIVKLSSLKPSNYSLLLNCHFDTVTDSPGASDDGAACAVLLELLRVFSQSKQPLRNNIIFLFNGAEENIMQASHGFVTQHKWAKEVKAFINIEACGAGGREMLFQAGPNNPWILEIYSKKVPYPYGSSLAQEIFESGLIPGDTDYRIFRDFGNASGLDFVWSKNGYVYHTIFDNVNQVPLGSLQRTGDNIQSLALGMVNGHQLSDMSQYRAGNLVYFDFLGAFVCHWSEFLANIINAAVLIVSLYSMYTNMRIATKEMTTIDYIKNLFICALSQCLAWIVALVVVLLIGIALTFLGRTMSWFTRPFWLLFLYVGPTVCVMFSTILFTTRKYQKNISSPWILFQLHCDGNLFIWSFVLFCGIIFRIRSAFIPLIWVLFPSVSNLLQRILFKSRHDLLWFSYHMLALFLPFVQNFYLVLGAFNLFIPIMGRSGAGNNSELMIAAIVGLTFALLSSFIAPFIILVRNPERVLSMLIGLFLISISMLILTPFGFPYSGDPNSPSPQRFMILHTNRTYHDVSGKVRGSDTGYWIVDLDINSPHTVDNFVPEMKKAQLVDIDCELELYCGLPYLLPVRHFIWKTHWISGPAPNIPIPTTFDYHKEYRENDVIRYHIKVTGPDHICIMISPFPDIYLFKWNLTSGTPLVSGQLWNDRPTYFIYYAYVAEPVPLSFHIDFKMPNKYSKTKSVMDIAVTSHYLHGINQRSFEFQKFLDQFPQWTAVNAWTATFTSYRV